MNKIFIILRIDILKIDIVKNGNIILLGRWGEKEVEGVIGKGVVLRKLNFYFYWRKLFRKIYN